MRGQSRAIAALTGSRGHPARSFARVTPALVSTRWGSRDRFVASATSAISRISIRAYTVLSCIIGPVEHIQPRFHWGISLLSSCVVSGGLFLRLHCEPVNDIAHVCTRRTFNLPSPNSSKRSARVWRVPSPKCWLIGAVGVTAACALWCKSPCWHPKCLNFRYG